MADRRYSFYDEAKMKKKIQQKMSAAIRIISTIFYLNVEDISTFSQRCQIALTVALVGFG